ncbi:MAG: restriction endonuclease subunit S [Actinomycetota bacterium]
MSDEFKKKQNNYIPEKWRIITLGNDNYVNLIMGQSPPSLTYNKKGVGLPFLQGKSEFKEIYPDPVYWCSSPIKIAEKNDLLLSVRAPVGDINIALHKSCIGRGLAAIRVKDKKVRFLFLFYYLKYSKKLLDSISRGSTFKAITKKELENFKIIIPPLPEQNKIAEILSSVDKTIEEVDRYITKANQLKKGLMKKLLTEGIGHKEYKETEIGRLPEEWKLVKLGDESIIEIRGNRRINGFDKVAFIPMEKIPDSNIFTTFEIRPINNVKSFTYCESGDILLAKITPSLENEKQGIVPDKISNGFALATTEVFPIFCKNINKFFLFYVLKYPKFRSKIITSMTGTTGRQRATKVSLKNLLIPLPPLPEQKKIAEILFTVDERIQLLKEKKNKLKRVKNGLLNDLLTGRRRVKVES